jgi:anti-sigma-K factor RskA
VTVDDDKDALAAEYVLGTLDAQERAQAELMMTVDAGFAAVVRGWETRLGALSAMVDSKEPPDETWLRVKARIAGVEPGPFKMPDAEAPKPAPEPEPERLAPAVIEPRADGAEIIQLSRRVGRWRAATMMTGALAACLVAFMVVREINPDTLPVALRPKPKIVEVTRTVEVTAPAPAEFVAVLQKDAFSPAFLLTLDLEKKTVTVRAVGAERQAGKSYELWLVSEKYSAPRSLGLIGDQQFTVRQALSGYDAGTINRATYAVSLEPEGGSPTGVPTGPVLYTGKLVQTTPPSISQTP